MSNSEKNSIVVTGLGIISPIGDSVYSHLNNLMRGFSGIKSISNLWRRDIFKSQVAGSIDIGCSSLPKNIVLAVSAVNECIEMADLTVTQLGETDLCFGTAVASSLEMEAMFLGKYEENPKIFKFNNATDHLTQSFGLSGVSYTVTTGCVAGMDALGTAFDLICANQSERILVAASDSTITPIVISSFDRIGALSKRNSLQDSIRPFDVNRDGFVIGEGGAAMLIETESSAKDRKVKILAELVGWHSISSGYHMTSMRVSGLDLVRLIKGLLEKCNVEPDEIDVVDTHGTSTQINDCSEVNAIVQIFSGRKRPLYLSAQKSCTGHSLGASNLLELVSVVGFLDYQKVPPIRGTSSFVALPDNINFTTDDLSIPISYILKISSGFSGIHSAFLLRKY